MAVVLPGAQVTSVQSTGTFSGNEITDVTRIADVQGDGAPVPAGVGIWESSTNLSTNGGFETNAAAWGTIRSATIARVASQSKFGTACAQVVVASGASDAGIGFSNPGGLIAATAGKSYTFSIWFNAPNGQAMAGTSQFWDAGRSQLSSTAFSATGSGAWQRVTVTAISPANTAFIYAELLTSSVPGVTFYVDGAQVEQKAFATPYIETNGGTATRAAARVQAPASLLSTTQCAVAFRVAYGFPSTTTRTNPCYLFDWRDDANNLLGLWLDTSNKWNAGRLAASAGASAQSAAQTFATDANATIIFQATGTQVKVSVNGGAFVSVGNTSIPTLAAALFDIASQAGASQFDGRVLWAATFTGVLANADAATLAALPNATPALHLPPAALQSSQWETYAPVGRKFRRVSVGDTVAVVG